VNRSDDFAKLPIIKKRMKTAKLLFPMIFSVLLSFSLVAQEAGDEKKFVPYEGQAGKDVIWVPTPFSLIEAMLDKAQVGPGDFLVDLGSGDGRIVIEAAKRGATAVGIEFNPEMVRLSELRARDEGVSDRASFLNMDLFEYDFSQATVVSMYLLSELNLKLRPRILEMKPGTRVVSNTFNLGNWIADAEIYAKPDKDTRDEAEQSSYNWDWTGYYWVVPAKIAGIWEFREGHLNIEQNYQLFHGTFIAPGKSSRIEQGKISGSEISFAIDGITYTGTVSNGQITGKSSQGNQSGSWTAIKAPTRD
jgi:precorrin-6B methylase 2